MPVNRRATSFSKASNFHDNFRTPVLVATAGGNLDWTLTGAAPPFWILSYHPGGPGPLQRALVIPGATLHFGAAEAGSPFSVMGAATNSIDAEQTTQPSNTVIALA